MNIRISNFIVRTLSMGLLMAVVGAGCDIIDIKDRPDPDNVSLDVIMNNPSRDEVSILATGTESGMRVDLRLYYIDVGMVGREIYRFLSAEPRFTGDLLGKANSELDDGSFYATRPWAAFYATIRNTNILMESAATSTALTDTEKNGVNGFGKTIKAYELLMALNLMNENGIRINVTDIFEPGPLVNKEDGFNTIATLLDEAATDLDNAGSAFSFKLSEGFQNLDTPQTFREFNRALAARVAVYRGNYSEALNHLQESFLDVNAPLTQGAYHIYSTAANDRLNEVYADPNASAGDSWVVHPSFVADAESGDQRVADKTLERDQNATLDGLSSDYGLYVYKTQTSPISIIRNEELILIRAEARIQTDDLTGGEDDLNVIRNAAGLPDYGGPGTKEALIDEMLRQRRYSLFAEGHRWIDMRRYNRLDELPIDRPGDNVWLSFPIPETENVNR